MILYVKETWASESLLGWQQNALMQTKKKPNQPNPKVTCLLFFLAGASTEGMKMRGVKNETNGAARANKVVNVDDTQMPSSAVPCHTGDPTQGFYGFFFNHHRSCR